MVAPIDYRIETPNPVASFAQGYNLGEGLAAKRDEGIARQAALDRQQKLNERISSVINKPIKTASDFTSLAMLLPEKEAKSMRENWAMIDKAQQEAGFNDMSDVLSALQSKRPDIAIERVKALSEAARNSGDNRKADILDIQSKMIDINPEIALTDLGFKMAAMPGGKERLESIDKFLSTRREEAEAPAKLSEAQSKAQSAAVAAKYAESKAVQDLEKGGWDIKKLANDITVSRQNVAIAAQNAASNRESNVAKRQENFIKLQELKDKREETIRGKAAEVDSARSNMDNMLNTADRILQTPVGVIGSAAGPLSSRMPTLSQDTADFEALIETLGNQVVMSRIGEMKGVLSDSDLKVLRGSLQSIDLKQSPERLMENVREAQRLILKGRKNLSAKYGMPDSIPDTPAVAPSGGDIDALLKKYGGQ